MTDNGVPWQNRIVGEGAQPASQFLANPANWRIHPQAQQDALRGALTEIGWVQRVVVNRRTGYLVDGHERVWQALRHGDQDVPYVEVDLSEDEEAYVLATLDPIGALAVADRTRLDALLREVQSSEAGVQAMLAELAERSGVLPDLTLPEPHAQQEPVLAADHVIEVHCSADDLQAFRATLDAWGRRPGVTVNIS